VSLCITTYVHFHRNITNHCRDRMIYRIQDGGHPQGDHNFSSFQQNIREHAVAHDMHNHRLGFCSNILWNNIVRLRYYNLHAKSFTLSVYTVAFYNNSSAGAERVTVWPRTWAEKWGVAVPLSVGAGELSPHLTQRPWAEAYLRTKWKCGILIHPTISVQYTNVKPMSDDQ